MPGIYVTFCHVLEHFSIHLCFIQKQRLDSIRQDPNLSRLLFDETHASEVELPENTICIQNLTKSINAKSFLNNTYDASFIDETELDNSLENSHLSDNDLDLKEKIKDLRVWFKDLQTKNDQHQEQIKILQQSIISNAENGENSENVDPENKEAEKRLEEDLELKINQEVAKIMDFSTGAVEFYIDEADDENDNIFEKNEDEKDRERRLEVSSVPK